VWALTCLSFPVTLGDIQPAPTAIRGAGHTSRCRKAATTMAKALFGHVVSPAQLVVEENAALRARVRRLEAELEELRAQRDAARDAVIASELLSMAGDNAEPALA
jgi:hypothetical protein